MMRSVLLNLISDRGTDIIFPDRGTDLGSGGLRNLISDLASAGAASKFAALDTLFFIRSTTVVDEGDRPSEIVLRPNSVTGDTLTMRISCLTSDGRTLSYPS